MDHGTTPGSAGTAATPRRAGVVAALNLVLPGLGHMYEGRIPKGIFWLVTVALTYLLSWRIAAPLHLFCILDGRRESKQPAPSVWVIQRTGLPGAELRRHRAGLASQMTRLLETRAALAGLARGLLEARRLDAGSAGEPDGPGSTSGPTGGAYHADTR